MSKKKIGVYLLSYRRPEYILQTIDSILRQTSKDFDLIVTENSGNDTVFELIKKYELQEQLKIIRREPSLSSIEHFNQILKEAQSSYPYFMMFHDDDIMEENCIEKLLIQIESHKLLAAVACNAYIIRQKSETTTLFNPYLTQNIVIARQSDLLNCYLTPQLSHPPFPSYLYRSSLIKTTILDKNKGGKHSDVSFLMSLIVNGPFLWISEPLVKYRLHVNNDSATISMLDNFRLCFFFFKTSPRHYFKIFIFMIKTVVKKWVYKKNKIISY